MKTNIYHRMQSRISILSKSFSFSKMMKVFSLAMLSLGMLIIGCLTFVESRTPKNSSNIRRAIQTLSGMSQMDNSHTGQSEMIRIPTMRVTIFPTGFYPKEITIKEGRYFLAVDNRSIDGSNIDSIISLGFRNDVTNALLGSVVLRKELLRWRTNLNLSVGKYTLTDLSNPRNICRITVVSK